MRQLTGIDFDDIWLKCSKD